MTEKITPREASEQSARYVAEIKKHDKNAQYKDRMVGDYERAVKIGAKDLSEADQVYGENIEYYQQKGMNKSDVRNRLANSLSRTSEGLEESRIEAAKHKRLGTLTLNSATEHYAANPDAHFQAAVAEAMLDGVHIDTGPEQLHAQNVSSGPVEPQK